MRGAVTGACVTIKSKILRAILASFVAVLLAAASTAQPLALRIESAVAGTDQRTREPVVIINFDASSKKLVADVTTQNVGRPMSIRVDGQVVISSVIREPLLGGITQISGGFTAEQARDIAARLSAGAAKLEFEITP